MTVVLLRRTTCSPGGLLKTPHAGRGVAALASVRQGARLGLTAILHSSKHIIYDKTPKLPCSFHFSLLPGLWQCLSSRSLEGESTSTLPCLSNTNSSSSSSIVPLCLPMVAHDLVTLVGEDLCLWLNKPAERRSTANKRLGGHIKGVQAIVGSSPLLPLLVAPPPACCALTSACRRRHASMRAAACMHTCTFIHTPDLMNSASKVMPRCNDGTRPAAGSGSLTAVVLRAAHPPCDQQRK